MTRKGHSKPKAQSIHRIRFFEKQVFDDRWRDTMAGKNEDNAIKIFENLGYVLGEDYVRQYPIGERFVMDFAFVKEQLSIEIDGKNHLSKKQREKDRKRDKYLRDVNWVIIRIQDSDMFGYKLSFYKNLIKEVVEERRKQYQEGNLNNIDIIRFIEEDYE